MKGNNVILIPGELHAPTVDGVAVSADGVKDYRLNKMQETINQEVNTTLQSVASMENVITTLETLGEQDVATALDHETRIQSNESDIDALKDQLSNYTLMEVTESQMESLIENDETDDNTLYLVPEEEDEEDEEEEPEEEES